MKKIFVFLILGILIVSCTAEKSNSDGINIDKIDKVSVLDFVDSIDVVQLETNGDCLIASINKVVFYNERYYVFDERQQSVFCFDSVGNYVFKIASKGQGSEEYLYLGDINVDKYNNQLLLLDSFGRLFCYDLDGRFISNIKLPKETRAYNEVYPVNKDTMVFVSLYEYRIEYYSKSKNKILDKRYKITNPSSLFVSGSVYTYRDSVFFSPPVSNDIINLTDSSVFSWNFGNKTNSKKYVRDLEKNFEDDDNRTTRPDYVTETELNYLIFLNQETSLYRFCVLIRENYQFSHIVLNKRDNRVVVFDKTTEGIQLGYPNNYTEDYVIQYESALKNVYYNINILSETQKNIINSHTENDNPFIIKYNFKK